jgi:hypothetical protein
MHLCYKHPIDLFKKYLSEQNTDWRDGGSVQESGGFLLNNWTLYLAEGTTLNLGLEILKIYGIIGFFDLTIVFSNNNTLIGKN